MKALAYLNYNRWVVDCPHPGCHDARAVDPVDPQTGVPLGVRNVTDVCEKGHPIEIVMPPPELEARIMAAVSERAEDADKAWYPDGHVRAQATGQRVGQTVDDLIRENDEVARFRSEDGKRKQLAATLAQLGVQVGPDGRFEGVL